MVAQTRVTLTKKYGITEPDGFYAGAVHAGLKTMGEKPLDLGVLYSQVPACAVGVFTTNKIKAAPVLLSLRRLVRKKAQAIVVNAGYANACSGEPGIKAAMQMSEIVAQKLKILPDDVLVASTGVIGKQLPIDRIKKGLQQITLSRDQGHDLARAIMTTDTRPKEIAFRFRVNDTLVRIGGIAKGAGMIHPNMATMLCFIATDALVDPDWLQTALNHAVAESFNMITVDGDTSPNDTVFVLANGMAKNKIIRRNSPEAALFQPVLDSVCLHLAKSIAADGEGATRLIEVTVESARSREDARAAARTIAGSSLVKTAVYGNDPNWGRILAALGRSSAEIVESKIDLYFGNLCLVKNGMATRFDKNQASARLKQKEVRIRLKLNLGGARATAWGCDLTEKYIATNSEYTT